MPQARRSRRRTGRFRHSGCSSPSRRSRVAPEHFGALPPAGEIVDAYFDGDALVVEMELDPELEHDYMRVPRSVADELAATIARPEQAVWCRVHWRNITGPHPASPSPD